MLTEKYISLDWVGCNGLNAALFCCSVVWMRPESNVPVSDISSDEPGSKWILARAHTMSASEKRGKRGGECKSAIGRQRPSELTIDGGGNRNGARCTRIHVAKSKRQCLNRIGAGIYHQLSNVDFNWFIKLTQTHFPTHRQPFVRDEQ